MKVQLEISLYEEHSTPFQELVMTALEHMTNELPLHAHDLALSRQLTEQVADQLISRSFCVWIGMAGHR